MSLSEAFKLCCLPKLMRQKCRSLHYPCTTMWEFISRGIHYVRQTITRKAKPRPSLGIPENNVEVVAAVVASPAQDVPYVPEQVAPIARVDVPHVPKQVAPIAPVDVPHVPEQVAPIAPVADSSPGKVSVTSSREKQVTTRFFGVKKRVVWLGTDNRFLYKKKTGC